MVIAEFLLAVIRILRVGSFILWGSCVVIDLNSIDESLGKVIFSNIIGTYVKCFYDVYAVATKFTRDLLWLPSSFQIFLNSMISVQFQAFIDSTIFVETVGTFHTPVAVLLHIVPLRVS